MVKQKRGEFNMDLKVLFMVRKKKSGVTSRQIAKELGVSVQTVSQMAGHLDEVKLLDVCRIAKLFEYESYGDFVNDILVRSKPWNEGKI